MAVISPISSRSTVVALLVLTFTTGLVDAISVLALGHVFVANMTGNIIFLGFLFVPHSTVEMAAVVVSCVSFVAGTVIGGRVVRRFGHRVRLWLGLALGSEIVLLSVLAIGVATRLLALDGFGKLVVIAALATTFGAQNAAARQFGVQELSTTVVTSTMVGIGTDSRMAGGTGERGWLRISVVGTMFAGAAVGATMWQFCGVAAVIALAALGVAVSLGIFRYGPPPADVA